MEKRYEINQELVEHQCESWHEDNWIFFKCMRCDFVRKIDCNTGDLVVIHQGDMEALHRGLHLPINTEELTQTPN